MGIAVATDKTFERLVLGNTRPAVVDFWAPWAQPCKLVVPVMKALAAKYLGAVDVFTVDVEENPGLSQSYNILSIPVIAFFRPGAQPQGVVGFRPLEQLEDTFGLLAYLPRTTTGGRSDGTHPIANRTPSDALDHIRKLGELRDAGVLTDEEFEAKKRDLLARL